MDIQFSWQDCGCAGVGVWICDCGFVESYETTMSSGDIWECPKCGKKIRLIWKGMGWEEVLPSSSALSIAFPKAIKRSAS